MVLAGMRIFRIPVHFLLFFVSFTAAESGLVTVHIEAATAHTETVTSHTESATAHIDPVVAHAEVVAA